MIKSFLLFLLLSTAASAKAQRMNIDDLLAVMSVRTDSALVDSVIKCQGFDKNATVDHNQRVFMGDTAMGVTKYSEMVFLQTFKGEVQLVQYGTRHYQIFDDILYSITHRRGFKGTMSMPEKEEISEGFSTDDYNILLETANNKTKFIISIWLKNAKL